MAPFPQEFRARTVLNDELGIVGQKFLGLFVRFRDVQDNRAPVFKRSCMNRACLFVAHNTEHFFGNALAEQDVVQRVVDVGVEIGDVQVDDILRAVHLDHWPTIVQFHNVVLPLDLPDDHFHLCIASHDRGSRIGIRVMNLN